MSKHIHIITLSILALSISATTRTETAQRDRLINSLEGTCLPKELEALVKQVNEKHNESEELYKKRNEDRKPHQLGLQAMQAFRDFGVSLAQTMPENLKPVYSPILEELHDNSSGVWYIYPYKLKDAWQELEQLAILQGKTLDDLSSFTPEQQKIAQEAISLNKIAQENSKSKSQEAWDKAWHEKYEALKVLGEKLTQVDDSSTSLEKSQVSVLTRLAEFAHQSSCKDRTYECPQRINTYLAARKAMVQATKEQK